MNLLHRFTRLRTAVVLLGLLLLTGLAIVQANAQTGGTFTLKRWAIANGGATFSTGGNFRLGGTIGQPNAGTSSGGGFTVRSGFWSAASSPQPSQLVLVLAILSFDNDLTSHADGVIERFRLGTQANPSLRATLLVDQKGEANTEVVEIAGGVVTHTDSLPWSPGDHELDTASPETIASFLNWARSAHLADRVLVALIGHGVGPAPEIRPAGASALGIFSSVPPLPQNIDNTPTDVTSGTYLSTPELGRALKAATNNGANPFDLLFLDQCFEGNLDVLYEVRDSAQILVASPNYAWAAYAYDAYLPHFTPAATVESLAQAIVSEYEQTLDNTHPNAIFWVRASDVISTANAASALGDALKAVISDQSSVNNILDAAMKSQFVDTTLCAGDLALCAPDELIGLGSFAANLQARFPAGSAVNTAATQVLAQINNVHSASITGHPWISPTVTWAYTDTLTILAPLTRTLTADTVWRASVYTSTVPLTATWASSPAVTQTVVITAPLAFTVNGRWDEFIAAWYQPLTPTVGQMCHAMPPDLIITHTESLTLTAQSGLVSALLNWTAVAEPSATGYALYVKRPGGVTWELLDTVPLSQRTYQHTGLASGDYAYFVAARNTQGDVVARSNEAKVLVGITRVEPDYGLNNKATALYIYGAGFETPVTVTVGSVPLQDVNVLSANMIHAVVPAGLTPGLYPVAVHTSMGQAIVYDAYRVLDASGADDLLSFPEWLWTDPMIVRVGQISRVGLNLQRLGGEFTLAEGVTVEFRLGGPQGTSLGYGWTPPLAPYTTTATSPINWTPAITGAQQVCATIDPANLVPESNETNNVTCRAINVLPPARDMTPPAVDRVVIADDAQSTSSLTVTLDVTATDYPLVGGSGVRAIKFIEFEYILGARRWVPVQQSGWINYATARADYPWTLVPVYGLRYLQAWAADNAGNVSLAPGVDVINLLPSTQIGYVAQNGVVFFAIRLERNAAFSAQLTPVDGDPDLYVWGPGGQLWHSNNGAGLEDAVTFNAPVTGTYQVEVHGFSDAHYRLAFGTGVAQQAHVLIVNDKPLPTGPAVSLSDLPIYFDVTPPDVTQYSIFLPIVMRH